MDIKFDNWFLYFSATVANLFSISNGCMMVWNSPIFPKLQSNDTSINPLGAPVTLLELSTIAVIYPVGQTIGTLFIGKLPDIIGRKKSLVYITIAAIVSFIGLSFADRVKLLYIFLPLIAASMSASAVVIPLYAAEIAEDHNRGKLGCIFNLSLAFGQLYAYVLGAVTHVSLFSLLCGAPLVLLLVLSLFIPESPIYLSSNGDKVGALLVLRKLRKTKNLTDVETEYNERQPILQSNQIKEIITFRSFFVSRAIKKGLLLSVATKMIQQLAGMHIVLTFLGPLLNEVGSHLSGDVLAILVAAIKLFAAVVAISIVEKVGRRTLILLATSLCSLSMFTLGLYFYIKTINFVVTENLRLIPIFAVICFVVVFTVGLSTIPFIVVAEVLPNELRSIGYSIAQFSGNLCTIFISFVYPIAADYFGVHYCMFFFSLVCFGGFVFLFSFLPETRGKSFMEIRNILN